MEIELLQKYLFIPLDIFQKNKQNVDIALKRDAWLTLFSSDDPDDIIELIEKYPEFRKVYEEAYEICLNIERVMGMFSKELYELDKNTVQYMIDEMQDMIDKQNDKLEEQQSTINEQHDAIEVQKQIIDEIQKENIKTQEQGIKNALLILQDLGISDLEIITHICKQYQIDEEQVRRFL